MLRLRSATRLLSVIIIIAVAEIISRFEPVLASVEPEPAPPLLEAPWAAARAVARVCRWCNNWRACVGVRSSYAVFDLERAGRGCDSATESQRPAGPVYCTTNCYTGRADIGAVECRIGTERCCCGWRPPDITRRSAASQTTTELADVVNAPSIRKM